MDLPRAVIALSSLGMTSFSPGGILAVHAHPDDESITMGATLAGASAAGIPTTVVTATLGEWGELMHGDHQRLDANHADQLGGYRYAEGQRACAALGVRQVMLGGLGQFRDSGMAGEPSAADPRAFIHAQRGGPRHDEAVALLRQILDRHRPAVILTYDATGGYGHPDHIAAHQVAAAAFARYETGRERLLEVVRPRAVFRRALNQMWRAPMPAGYRRGPLDQFGTFVADDSYHVAVDARLFAAARRRALREHRTQLDVWPGRIDGFALTNLLAQPLLDAEYFRVLAGPAIRLPQDGASPTTVAALFAGLPQDGPSRP